jgi:hypothetical protein
MRSDRRGDFGDDVVQFQTMNPQGNKFRTPSKDRKLRKQSTAHSARDDNQRKVFTANFIDTPLNNPPLLA